MADFKIFLLKQFLGLKDFILFFVANLAEAF